MTYYRQAALLAKQSSTPDPESSLLKACRGASPRARAAWVLVSAMGKDLGISGALG